MSELPATLKSLYRLCLRASSASVLHHRVASPNIRRLLRPSFDAAASVSKELQKGCHGNGEARLKAWLGAWEQRMDNTLALLYTSSQSRGLPHRLTRNLGFLVLGEHQRLIKHPPQRTWNPQAPTAPTPPDAKKEERKKQRKVFVANAWASLNQVVKLAEGRDGLSLGRVTVATMSRKRRFK